MVKRILAMALCLALLLCALPLSASAASGATTPSEICKQISRMYYRTLYASGLETLTGYCGTMTAYQLYYMGVDKYPLVHDGKDGYDLYKNLEFSSGGYRVRTYPATKYSLEEALYTMCCGGTRDVYNILVGFQRTDTEAGRYYGHSMVIHAILDGKVYFTESFSDSAFGMIGNPACLSIAAFARYYDSWCVFEGAVLFDKKDYDRMSTVHSSSYYVQLTEDAQIVADICQDPAQAAVLRTVRAGERLRSSAVIEDMEGRLYYRVSDDGSVGYIAADAAAPLQDLYEDISLQTVNSPSALAKGRNFTAKVTAVSTENTIHAVKISVRDAQGEQVLTYEEAGAGCMVKLNKTLQTGSLAEGCYTYEITANVLNHYVAEGQLSAEYKSVVLHSSQFTVGNAEMTPDARETSVEAQAVLDGWVYDDGTWYCYDNGMPRTGWYCDQGIDYYLKSDGSVTTGWSMINGKGRYFSDTGALRTGWLETDHDTYYMLSNGVAAKGWHIIDGARYYFQENGWLLKGTWLEQEDGRYYLLSDGKAATGWHELEDGNYYFGTDGRLQSQMFEQDGKTFIRLFREGTDETVVFPALQNNG